MGRGTANRSKILTFARVEEWQRVGQARVGVEKREWIMFWNRARCGVVVLMLLLPFLFFGCRGGGVVAGDKLTGELGQVLVVTESPIKGEAFADSIRSLFGEEYPYLPQVEPKFDMIFVPVKNFTGVFRSFRNVLVIDYKQDTTACGIYSADGRWADGQTVVYVVGPDASSVWEYMRAHAYELEQTYEQAERHRLIDGYQRARSEDLSRRVYRRFGVELDIPKSMVMRVDTTDFMWISLETADISQGILCYRYVSPGSLYSVDTLVLRRNAFTQRYIPGPNPGTYMQVSEFITPELKHLRYGDDSLVCVRGLWEVYGHAMGGSFLSHARLNAAGDSVVVTEGYIYAPRFGKRDYMRQLEAILLSHVVQ